MDIQVYSHLPENPAVPVSEITPLLALLAKAGIPFEKLLGALSLPSDLFDQPQRPSKQLTLGDYLRLLGQISRFMQDEACQLSSRAVLPGTLSFLLDTIIASHTLGEAMHQLSRSTNILYGGEFNQIQEDDQHVAYIVDDQKFPFSFESERYHYLTTECALLYTNAMFSLATNRRSEQLLLASWTRRPDTMRECDPLSTLGKPMRYGCSSYRLYYHREALALPITLTAADQLLPADITQRTIAITEHQPDKATPGENLIAQLESAFEQQITEQKAVAQRLNMSTATLKRRLLTHGLTFRHCREQFQDRQAKALLAKGSSPSDVAEHLGFSDSRSFYRAFKSQNGITPRAYIDQRLKPS